MIPELFGSARRRELCHPTKTAFFLLGQPSRIIDGIMRISRRVSLLPLMSLHLIGRVNDILSTGRPTQVVMSQFSPSSVCYIYEGEPHLPPRKMARNQLTQRVMSPCRTRRVCSNTWRSNTTLLLSQHSPSPPSFKKRRGKRWIGETDGAADLHDIHCSSLPARSLSD